MSFSPISLTTVFGEEGRATGGDAGRRVGEVAFRGVGEAGRGVKEVERGGRETC